MIEVVSSDVFHVIVASPRLRDSTLMEERDDGEDVVKEDWEDSAMLPEVV
jgi:hypothetical protein